MPDPSSHSPAPQAVQILDATSVQRALRRIAHEIIEQNPALDRLVLVGIPNRGVEMARRIRGYIGQIEQVEPEFGIIDVAMHRDDLRLRSSLPSIQASQLPIDLNDRTLVLVDDVFYTGRTCRAALDAIASFGRPARIQLAVLVDRGHRELPIRPDYVGKNLPTSDFEKVRVRFQSIDSEPDAVWLWKPEGEAP